MLTTLGEHPAASLLLPQETNAPEPETEHGSVLSEPMFTSDNSTKPEPETFTPVELPVRLDEASITFA